MSDAAGRIDELSPAKRALVVIRELQARLDQLEQARREPIAIIGVACRFPGGADTPEAFWELLRDGVDAIREVPPERWDAAAYYDPDPDAAGKMYSSWGGFLDGVDQFDAAFFGIAPREAAGMDPQHRLLLEVAYEALERAGVDPRSLGGSPTGVFVGITTNDYAEVIRQGDRARLEAYTPTGNALNAAAGRIAYTLGLQGPCMAVDTACSSSLVALHLACQSLRLGESAMALAGGVNLILTPDQNVAASRAHMLAADGRCKTFDAAADGYVRAEGCGMIVLKRLSDAQRDGDPILALIRGSAVNQDGPSGGFTVPSGLAQQAVIRQALSSAGVAPAEVGYVEAHGTGTALGDPIEVEALGAALGQRRSPDRPLLIGALKTNVGHLESAAGVAGVIKVVLALAHEQIPPQLHFRQLNPRIALGSIPAQVATAALPWPRGERPRIAGVSAFGFSGTNAHVVIEEPPAPSERPALSERSHHLLTLSAHSPQALRALAGRYAGWLAGHPAAPLADICATSNRSRAALPHRLACVADTPAGTAARLDSFAAGGSPAGTAAGHAGGERPLVAFLCSGQGSQYQGMGGQLYLTQPVFRAAFDRCAELLRGEPGPDLRELVFAEPAAGAGLSPLDRTEHTQPALFALEYALAELWRSWGVRPDYVIGHSVGEYVAACLAGVFSLEDGLRLVAARGRLMGQLPDGGAMAAVAADEATVAAALADHGGAVALAAVNGPADLVIAGAAPAVAAICERLQAQGVKTRPLAVSHAFHSPLVEPMLDPFEQLARGVAYRPPALGLASNLSGQLFGAGEAPDAAYWRRHARAPVRFAEGVAALRERGVTLFVEIGPGATLLGMARRAAPADAGVWLPSLRSGQDDWQQILSSLGGLHAHGLPVDWEAVNAGYSAARALLPTYPFERECHWVAPAPRPARPVPQADAQYPWLGRRLRTAVRATVFEAEFSLPALPILGDHRLHEMIVVAGACHVAITITAAERVFGGGGYALEQMLFTHALVMGDDEPRVAQCILTPDERGAMQVQVHTQPLTDDDAEQPWTLHATGRLRPAPEAAPQDAPALDGARARCGDEQPGAALYRALDQVGYQLGPAFAWIETYWRGAGEAVARMRPPQGRAEAAAGLFHPGLVDSCFQLLGATNPEGALDETTYVPLDLERFQLYARPSGPLWVYARSRSRDDQRRETFVGDIWIYDEGGKLLAEGSGMRLKRAGRDVLLRNRQRPDGWLHTIRWEPAPALAPPEAVPPGSWLILADAGGIGQELAAQLEARGQRCVVVRAGPDGAGALNPARPEAFRALLAESFPPGQPPCRGVVQLWGLDAPALDDSAAPSLAQMPSCVGTLHLVQALAQASWRDMPRLWLVTRGATPAAGQPVAAAQAPLWGMGRVIVHEHPDLRCACVDLDPQGGGAAELLAELLADDREDQVALRGQSRLVARLDRLGAPEVGGGSQRLDLTSEGTVLITGGLGGLGLVVAEWLVERGARHLLLLGRRAPGPDAQAAIDGLMAQGAQVVAAQADVADAGQLAAALELAARELPPLRGVVHAAGVLDDGILLSQSAERFAGVLRPKADGAWHLHRLTAGQPLDFFVLFSSASALLGVPGQANYAAANAFLDGLAHWRRALGLPALSINWGPWAEVGMAAAARPGARLSQGMAAISPEQGTALLGTLLESPLAQAAVLNINVRQWRQLFPRAAEAPLLARLVDGADRIEAAAQAAPLREGVLAAPEGHPRRQALEAAARAVLADVLGTPAARIDPATPLRTLGLDSLMSLELRNRLETGLGVSLPSTVAWSYPTLGELCGLLAEKLELEPPPAEPAAAPAGMEDLARSLDQLSEDEMLALLAQEIDSLQGGKPQ